MTRIIQLKRKNLERIMEIERKAFIPSIKTTEKNILDRLSKEHVYLGAEINEKLVGTLAFRYAYFVPDFEDFCKRNSTFNEYAETPNDEDANAVFVYSLGTIPEYRNGLSAKRLIQGAINIGREKGMKYLIGDARIPSYNGSDSLPYEQFDKNQELHEAVDNYFKTREIPEKLIKQDSVAGFYLRAIPNLRILGITDENFWKGDEPCGGHMVIEYMNLK